MMRVLRILVLVAVLATTASILFAGDSQRGTAGKYTVELTTQPSPPTVGQNQLLLTITDGEKPLTGAAVQVHLDMEGMAMPADVDATPGSRGGEYLANVNLGMAGTWKASVNVQQMAGMTMTGDGKATFTLQTASAPASSAVPTAPGRVPLLWIVLGGIVVLGAIVVGFIAKKK